MSKFIFRSSKKNKFNFLKDNNDITDKELIGSVHTEIFLNKKLIIEGCQSIADYQNDYIKLKVKKGFLNIVGNNFLITEFDNEKIIIKGIITSVEFCL